MRRDVAQLHAGTGNDFVRFIFRTGQPANIFAALEHPAKSLAGLSAKGFKQIRRQLAHVPKHVGTMPTDQLEISDGGEANLESVGHGSKRPTPNAERPILKSEALTD
jgi:hypothetical protein